MSHTVSIKTEVRDVTAVKSACRRLGLAQPVEGQHKLFAGEAVGLAVQLPEWIYPAVCELATGQVRFDNFSGRWGEKKHLDRFLQAYAVEKTKIEARKKGHTVNELQLADGSIKLTVQLAGGAA